MAWQHGRVAFASEMQVFEIWEVAHKGIYRCREVWDMNCERLNRGKNRRCIRQMGLKVRNPHLRYSVCDLFEGLEIVF